MMEKKLQGQSCVLGTTGNPMPPSSRRPKGTMVTYGGMAKQPVTVPVVSTGDALGAHGGLAYPLLHSAVRMSRSETPNLFIF